jgi:hypothetical protein
MATVTSWTAAKLQSAIDTVNASLALKADLVSGLLPDSQLPADVITTASLTTAMAAKADLSGGVLPDAQAPAIAVKKDSLTINVKDHGATGNGTTADDAAITTAIGIANPTFGGKVFFPPGTYLLSGSTALALSVAGMVLEGSGAEVTKIVIGSGFTGAAAISITANNCQVRDLSVVGANSTTTSNPIADGIDVSACRRTKITNCDFWYINGWATKIAAGTGSSNNPDGTMLSKLIIRSSAGGIYWLGNAASGDAVNSFMSDIQIISGGVTTGASANLDGIRFEDSWDILGTNLFTWTSSGTGSAFHIKGNCAASFIKNLDALGPSTGSNVLIEDGPNGSPQNVQLDGGVIQQGSIGLRITGGASHVHVNSMRFINNQTHAISVEGTGNPISFHDVFISGSGAGASGTNYDINWSGSSTGYVNSARFVSPIVASGTSGVQFSVNVALNQSVRFINVNFAGTGASSSNWFTNLPSAVLEVSSGPFNFATAVTLSTTATLNGGANSKGNLALQPTSSTNTVISGNVNGSDGFDRFRIDGTGKITAGTGSAARDASWGRQGVAQYGTADSDIIIGLAGKGIRVKEGTNARMGTATLTAGAVTVVNNTLTSNTRIFVGTVTPAGTPGALFVGNLTAGTNFQIKSTSSTDTSIVSWLLVEAA